VARLKFKPAAPLSDWIEYRLKTTKLEPAALRLKLRPLDRFDIIDASLEDGEFRAGRTISAAAAKAVVEWELDDLEGKTIPCNEETKAIHLPELLAEELADKPPGTLLGIQVVKDARNRETFLKN
jgi:hypothetical protein